MLYLYGGPAFHDRLLRSIKSCPYLSQHLPQQTRHVRQYGEPEGFGRVAAICSPRCSCITRGMIPVAGSAIRAI